MVKQTSGFLGTGRGRRRDYKEAEEKPGNDDYLHLDYGDGVSNMPKLTQPYT